MVEITRRVADKQIDCTIEAVIKIQRHIDYDIIFVYRKIHPRFSKNPPNSSSGYQAGFLSFAGLHVPIKSFYLHYNVLQIIFQLSVELYLTTGNLEKVIDAEVVLGRRLKKNCINLLRQVLPLFQAYCPLALVGVCMS